MPTKLKVSLLHNLVDECADVGISNFNDMVLRGSKVALPIQNPDDILQYLLPSLLTTLNLSLPCSLDPKQIDIYKYTHSNLYQPALLLCYSCLGSGPPSSSP